MAEQSALALAGDRLSSEKVREKSAFSTPARREYREIPTNIGFSEWDRVPQVRAILRELEQGMFQRASLLSVLQERDDRLSGCWSIRTDTLLGVPLEMEPALVDGHVTPETEEIAEAAEVDWPKMFPEGSIDRLFKQGRDLGLAVGELVTFEDEATGRWLPRLKVWHTQWVWWNWGTESYWINTSGAYDENGNPSTDGAGVIELPRVDRDTYSDGHWVVYCPGGFRYAFQRGIIRSTAMLHLKRQWDMRDWARYNEVYGLLIRKAVTPAGATENDKDRFATSIRDIGSEPTVECPTDATGAAYDIDIVGAPTGSGYDTFGQSLHYIDECIGNAILGQQAAGEKKGGLGDGDANQNESVRQDILEKDARIFEVLKAQALSWWALWNFGDKRLCPTPSPIIDPPETAEKQSDRLLKAGQAISAIAAALPGVADLAAIAAELGVPLLAPGETPVASAPIEGGDDAPDKSDEKPTGLRALSTAPRRKRAVTYADRVATASIAAGARAIAPDLADVRRIVKAAKSPEELRAALVEKYRSMDPRKFADVVERAQVMAELDGRYDVLEKT